MIPAKCTRCGAARWASRCSGGLPVLVEEERARVLDALVQVVVDVAGLLAGRLDERLERGPELVLLARSGLHVGDHREQIATVVGRCGHGRLQGRRSVQVRANAMPRSAIRTSSARHRLGSWWTRSSHGPPAGRRRDGRGGPGLAGAAERGAARDRRRAGPVGRRDGRRAPTLVLHPDRSRWPDDPPAAARAAARGDAAGGLRPVPARLRHGGHDHGPGERPRSHRGFRDPVRPRARSRPRPVLPARLRRPGRRRHLGLAVRRAPRLPEQPDRRRRTGLHHAVLHGRRSGVLRAARRRGEPSARPASRTWPGNWSGR